MKKLIQCFAVMFLLTTLFNAQAYSAGEAFRSAASGNWNANSTWQMYNGSVWVPATSTPNEFSGSITIQNLTTVTVTANVSADQVTVDGGGILSINAGIVFTLLNGATDFTILSGGTVSGAGTFQTQGNLDMNLRTGSNFNISLKVNSGTTTATDFSSPYQGKLFGSVTVDSGATLSSGTSSAYFLYVYGNLINNGTITGAGFGNEFKFYGPALTNNGAITSPIFKFDSTSTASGFGTFTGADIYISANGNVSLLNNVTFSPSSDFFINTGGTLNLNTRTLTLTSGTFTIFTGGTVLNSGIFRTQNAVTLNLRTGSSFNAPLNVNSGTTTATDFSSPYRGKLFGSVTVDAGATLSSGGSSAYFLYVYGNLINNGTITGAGFGNEFKFFGPALTNNGAITSPIFKFDSTSTVSGSGTFTGADIYISANGNVSLLNNMTFSPTSEFIVNTGGILTANSFILTFNSGTFELQTGATVANSGTFRTQNNVTLNLRTGSFFNVQLNVNTGTTSATDFSSPYLGRLYGKVIIDAVAILSSGNSSAYNLLIYGNITNNGTITGVGDVEFQSGVHTLQGTGIWTTTAFLLSGATVNLTSNHQFLNTTINPGATFNMGSNTVKFTASNPIIQNGTLLNVGSKIEYNGTAEQNISATNITYYGLRINNPEGTVLLGNVTVNDTLSVILGDLDLDGKIITVSSTGYLTETPGNTVKGNLGHITTTRNIGIPSSLNVGGFGAILTATTNLGSTEIRRGHAVQTGGSIRRYFDITPTNNSGLSATLKFKYDDSELNLRPEPTLKLLKSINGGASFTLMGGTVNTTLNEITLSGLTSFSRWTADSSGVSAVITMAIEGFYNPSTNRLRMQDTVRIYLRNISAPYAIVDSARTLLDSVNLRAACVFANAPNGTYYIQTKHRNSLETWSRAGGETYSVTNTLNYDFTSSAAKAFGDNQVQVDASPLRFAIYSGDVSQDGVIDGSDAGIVDNDAANFESGYVGSDVNGDRFVDGTDASIVDNNAFNFVTVARP